MKVNYSVTFSISVSADSLSICSYILLILGHYSYATLTAHT